MRFVMISLASCVISLILSQISSGLSLLTYYHHGPNIIRNWAICSFFNQSLSGILLHVVYVITGYHISKASYILVFEVMSSVIVVLGMGVLLYLGSSCKSPEDWPERFEINFAAACIVNVFVLPLVWPFYFILLILPFLLLCKNIHSKRQIGFIGAMIFTSFPLFPV